MTEEELKAQIAALAARGSSGGPATSSSSSSAGDAPVWLGGVTKPHTTGATQLPTGEWVSHGYGPTYTPGGAYKKTTADAAAAAFLNWDIKQLRSWQDFLTSNGLQPSSYDDLKNAWATAVTLAAQSYYAYSKGHLDKPMTPQEAFKHQLEIEQQLGYGPAGAAGSSGPVTVNRTDTTTYSASDRRAYADDAFQTYLGRDPRKGEIAAATPGSSTVSSSQTTSADGTSVTESSENGPNMAQLAKEYAQSRPDYAEYQAVANYLPALMSVLGPVR